MTAPLYFFLYFFYAGLFLSLIFKWKFFNIEDVKKQHLAFFFLLKAAGGLALTLIYTYYYTDPTKADIYRYFNDSKIISSVLFTDPLSWLKIMSGFGMNDADVFPYILNTLHFSHPATDPVTNNSFLIRIISLVNYFSFYNIYIDTLIFNFITFIGLVALFKVLKIYFQEFQEILYLPIFLIPSVIFWSSGLLKESLLLVGISFYLYAWLNGHSVSWRNYVIILASLVVVVLTKSYVAVILIACSFLLPLKKPSFPLPARIIFGLLIGFFSCYYMGADICEKIIDKRNQFISLALSENAGSTLDTGMLTPSCSNLWALVPSAWVNALLRPFAWDKGSPLQYFFAAENLLFILSMGFLLFYFKKPQGGKLLLALFFILFALLNYLGIGLTVPILGAIVHYRVVAMPFLLTGVLLLTDLGRIKNLLK